MAACDSLPAAKCTSRHRIWLARVGPPLVVVLLTAIAFLPAMKNGFVNWDDDAAILDNPHIRSFDWASIKWAFTTFHMGPYQPLSWLSLALDHAVWGSDPWGFHFSSLLLHVAAAASFCFVVRQMTAVAQPGAAEPRWAREIGAMLAALLFSIHPLRVESVAWATTRRDVLCGLFTIWSVWAYVRAATMDQGIRRRAFWLVLSWLAYAAALLSKATPMGLPLVLTVLDVYPLRRLGRVPEWLRPESRWVWLEKVPYWALSLPTAAAAFYGQQLAGGMAKFQDHGLIDRLAVCCYAIMFYIVKTLVPVRLSPYYEMPTPLNPLSAGFVTAALTTLAISLALFRYRYRVPALLAVWISYLILLAPVSGLTQAGSQITADRYSYLPCLGFALLAGAGLTAVLRARWVFVGRGLAVLSFAAVAGLCIVRTDESTSVGESLWVC